MFSDGRANRRADKLFFCLASSIRATIWIMEVVKPQNTDFDKRMTEE